MDWDTYMKVLNQQQNNLKQMLTSLKLWTLMAVPLLIHRPVPQNYSGFCGS